jgi:hypothetical protein
MIDELNALDRDSTKGCTGGELGCRRCHPLIVVEHVGQLVSP